MIIISFLFRDLVIKVYDSFIFKAVNNNFAENVLNSKSSSQVSSKQVLNKQRS